MQKTMLLVGSFVALSACGGSDTPDPNTDTATSGGEAAADAPADGATGDAAAPAGAQGPQGAGVETDAREADTSVMVDETGRIGFRADVQLELETLPGTPAEAVQKMGAAVQRRMTDVRGCYDRAVASDPEIQGVLKLLLETNARRVVSADVTEAGLERGRITECVLRTFRRLPRGELPASARLWVVLRASNTMAAGMREVREAQEAGGATP